MEPRKHEDEKERMTMRVEVELIQGSGWRASEKRVDNLECIFDSFEYEDPIKST